MALDGSMAIADFPRKAKMWFSLLLIIAGLAMYWSWGLLYGAWNPLAQDYLGVWAIVSVLVGSGVLGLLIIKYEE